jgi:hypothetical protein
MPSTGCKTWESETGDPAIHAPARRRAKQLCKRAKMRDMILKLVLAVYLVIAFLVGVQRHRESGAQANGTVVTILEGAAWPITLLIDAVQRK